MNGNEAARPRSTAPPAISVIVPAMNEEATIGAALGPLMAESVPGGLEIIVAVAPSKDRTRAVVEGIAGRDPRVRLIDNPARVTPIGLNLAIAASRGDVILRMDGHAVPEPGYVAACLAVLESSGAWNVGGELRKHGRTTAARAAAAATSSSFGIGGGRRFHLATEAADVDTVWPGCWPRWVFEQIGLFDPEMVRNQDDELNQRILDAGGRIRFDPSIKAAYESRASWRGLDPAVLRVRAVQGPRATEAASTDSAQASRSRRIRRDDSVHLFHLARESPLGSGRPGSGPGGVVDQRSSGSSAGCGTARCNRPDSRSRIRVYPCRVRAWDVGGRLPLRAPLGNWAQRIRP